jgi:hypothetical protein
VPKLPRILSGATSARRREPVTERRIMAQGGRDAPVRALRRRRSVCQSHEQQGDVGERAGTAGESGVSHRQLGLGFSTGASAGRYRGAARGLRHSGPRTTSTLTHSQSSAP